MKKSKVSLSERLIDVNSPNGFSYDERYRIIADNMPFIAWVAGSDANHYFFNSHWLQFTGKKLEEEINNGWIDDIHFEDVQMYLEKFKKGFNSKEAFNIEFRLKPKDGSYKWMHNLCHPNINNGNFEGYTGVCIDIHELKKEKQLLIDNMESIQLIVDSIPNLAWRNNANGKAIYTNRHWFELTGQTTDELIKDGPKKYVHPDDFLKVDELWIDHSTNLNTWITEIRYLRGSDKTYRWHLVHVVPIKNNNGEITSWISTGTDIHEQKLLADELQHQIAERNYDLMNANKNLKRSNKELEQLAYVASHNLQEPLRKIIMYTGRINSDYSDQLTDKAKEDMLRISGAAKLVAQLIHDVMSFSKLAIDNEGFVSTNLNLVLKDSLNIHNDQIILKNAKISSEKLPAIDAIPEQTLLLFNHLIDNAIKYCDENSVPVISITTRKLTVEEAIQFEMLPSKLDFIEICFRDEGIGFDDQLAEQIFIIFRRLHDKTEFPGTGIGLALCRKIVENHNGIIFAKSQKNKGTTLNVILPIHQF